MKKLTKSVEELEYLRKIAKGSSSLAASAKEELRKYDENEERDDHGRWVAGGDNTAFFNRSGNPHLGDGTTQDPGWKGEGARAFETVVQAGAGKMTLTAAYKELGKQVKNSLSDYIYRGKGDPEMGSRLGASLEIVNSGTGGGADWIAITQRDSGDPYNDKEMIKEMTDQLNDSGYGKFLDITQQSDSNSITLSFNSTGLAALGRK
jgi:hypothetical protein